MQRRYRKPRPEKDIIKKFRVNDQIRAENFFVIDALGNQLGVMSRAAAVALATEAEMDLVEVSPLANPPVVRIMNYGQYKYETEKKIRKAKAHQKISETKSIRLSFRIKGQDLATKQKQAIKFIQAGHKAKIETILRGRERAHRQIAIENLKKFIDSLGPHIKIVQPIQSLGGQITVTVIKT